VCYRRRDEDVALHPPRAPFFLLILGAATLLTAACRNGGGQSSTRHTIEWNWLDATSHTLEARRTALAACQSDTACSRSPRLKELEGEVGAMTTLFDQRLVAFLATDPPRTDHRPSARQREALRLKIAEDVLAAGNARLAGEPRQALALLRPDLAIAPDNPELRRLVADIAAHRGVRPEAFSQVARGMSEDDVRRLLGPPNPQHIKAYERIGMVGWFYAKDGKGAAAAVWFDARSGTPRVASTDWSAIAGSDPRLPSP
jgi:hypothetical protein